MTEAVLALRALSSRVKEETLLALGALFGGAGVAVGRLIDAADALAATQSVALGTLGANGLIVIGGTGFAHDFRGIIIAVEASSTFVEKRVSDLASLANVGVTSTISALVGLASLARGKLKSLPNFAGSGWDGSHTNDDSENDDCKRGHTGGESESVVLVSPLLLGLLFKSSDLRLLQLPEMPDLADHGTQFEDENDERE